MLGHRSGVIGFPLRLLAREVYDRVVAARGPGDVALITGEEKIVPPKARYFLCTVESMPLDWGADFLAVDEIQLCADPERGHVFTNRLLSARGRLETLFLGAAAMRDRIEALLPGARFQYRDRLSTLSYAGSKKLSRMPTRSAIVAFSVDSVYAIAELIRRQKGGAAVVMGALSPRTRNAQVALYQEGEVDYLVATDAIGMGLNLDVRHVAFAGLAKFDGRRHRRLGAGELAQIAGRAGRHMNDGTFGVTGEAPPLDPDLVTAIEEHRFPSVGRLQWRSAVLEYATPESLLRSLERDPGSDHLSRAREADDVAALRVLMRDETVRSRAKGRPAVRLLWDVCQVPDFRKTLPAEHAALLGQLYAFLSEDGGAIPEEWIAAQCDRLDRVDGDIDALSKRLAYIRTWTYVANRSGWLRDPGQWRGRTREIEDRLSDALHERLTQTFVDRRTSVLAKRLKQRESLVAEVDDSGAVTVEGQFVGRLEGFNFQADPSASPEEAKTLLAAGREALAAELERRVQSFYNAPDAEIAITEQGGLMWGDAAVGRLEATAAAGEGGDPLSVRATPFADEMLDQALKDKIARRLQFWIDRKIEAVFEPLIKLRDDPAIAGLARGVAFQLVERMGVIPRQEIADQIKALDQDARRPLRQHQVRFGQHTVFIPALLKPAATRLRVLLWGLGARLAEIPEPPPPGHVTIPADPNVQRRYFTMAGYHRVGDRAIRLDMLERLADLIRPMDARAGFEATPDMLSLTGSTLEQFADLMGGLGYQVERGERPKAARPRPVETDAPAAEAAPADGAAVAADETASQTSGDGVAEHVAPPAESAEIDAAPGAKQSTETAPGVGAEDATLQAAPATEESATALRAAEQSETGATAVETAPGSAEPAGETAPAETAPDDTASTSDGAEGAEAASTEREVFFLFKSAPRGRRRPEGRDADAGGGGQRRGQGDKNGDARGAKGRKPKGKRRDGPGGPPGKRGGKDGRGAPAPREYSAAPKARREKKIDPDSPFAVLQRLKDGE
ncbi:MAG: helicase-related protein [Pseudomonadota bacterium]